MRAGLNFPSLIFCVKLVSNIISRSCSYWRQSCRLEADSDVALKGNLANSFIMLWVAYVCQTQELSPWSQYHCDTLNPIEWVEIHSQKSLLFMWFKRTDIFEWCICLIVSHASPCWAWCVSTQLLFLSFDTNWMVTMTRKHVASVRPEVPYHVLSSFSQWISYQVTYMWHAVN